MCIHNPSQTLIFALNIVLLYFSRAFFFFELRHVPLAFEILQPKKRNEKKANKKPYRGEIKKR